MMDKQGLLFLKKKKQKDFFIWATGARNARLQYKKSFLRRFFSKKRLTVLT